MNFLCLYFIEIVKSPHFCTFRKKVQNPVKELNYLFCYIYKYFFSYYLYDVQNRFFVNFYSIISNYYDYIFPDWEVQLEFIKTLIPKVEINVLDIGCGTGTLSYETSKHVKCLAAVDNDLKMIELARKKYIRQKNLHLINLDMRKASEYFLSIKFALIYSFGNTLAHLDSPKEIDTFFQDIKIILKEDGRIAFQILNYDYILDNKMTELPLIENEMIKFERYYHFNEDKKITFHTILTVKPEKLVIENKIKLLPIRKNVLENILIANGFANVQFYSSFAKEAYKADALPLIVTALAQ